MIKFTLNDDFGEINAYGLLHSQIFRKTFWNFIFNQVENIYEQ